MLSDAKIHKALGFNEFTSEPTKVMLTQIANAAIAAYQAELRQGVELPEDIEAWIEPMTSDELKAAIQQYAAACAAQARLRALEDAKRVCEAEFTVEGIAQRCAAAIDKLKGGE